MTGLSKCLTVLQIILHKWLINCKTLKLLKPSLVKLKKVFLYIKLPQHSLCIKPFAKASRILAFLVPAMYIKTHIIALFWALLFTSLLNGQIVEIKPQTQQSKINILPIASLSNPTDYDFTLDSILQNPSALNFKKIGNEKPNISFTSSHYWLTFDIKNATHKKVSYYLETARPIIDNVDCYIVDNTGQVTTYHSGDNMPFSERAVQHRKIFFKLDLEAGSSYKIYIHYKSDGEVLNIPLVLRSPTNIIETSQGEQLVFGLFYGILILAAVTYLFFFIGMQDKSFLYYGLYVLTIGLLQFSLDGLFYQYIMPSGNWLYLRSLVLAAIASPYFMGKYVVEYLGIAKNFKLIPKVFSALNICLGILFIAVLVSPSAFEISYPIVNLLGLGILVLALISMFKIWHKKRKIDFLFAIGIFCLVLGFTIFILNNLGVLPNSLITEHSTKLGTGLEVIFLSLSMANRIHLLKSEKEKIQEVALQKAEEANEVKTYFMSMMSHELRTPLNAIMGIADVMEKEVTNTKIKSNFNLIKYSSVSLLSSVNDILDFSKLEKGELTLENENFNPKTVIDQIKNNWYIQAENKGIKCTCNIDEDLPKTLKGDATRLIQILNNLLSNAVKFTPAGNITLSIEASKINSATINLKIIISDSGIGIPPSKLDSIFESFMQQNINDKRKFGGFGLGLSIVKSLVKLHNGTINIESNENKGTTFTVALPYTVVEQAKKQSVGFSTDTFDLKGSKILVVEDNDVNQFIMKTILTRWGDTKVDIADNGSEALAALRENKYDIVLMDLQMPVMDGYEATTEIRSGKAGENNKSIPIIAVTADVMETTKIKVKNVGMDDYMTKPVDQGVLYDKITLLLSARYTH